MAEPEKVRSSEASGQPIAVELIAVLVAVADGRPLAMTIDEGRGLPSGPFEVEHRSLQAGMRAWVERQTRLPPGYVEKLHTFADPGRRNAADEARAISISYLGLTREERTAVPRTVETAPGDRSDPRRPHLCRLAHSQRADPRHRARRCDLIDRFRRALRRQSLRCASTP